MQKTLLSLTIHRLKFYLKLRQNNYTNQLLEELSKLKYKGSYSHELKSHLGVKKNISLDAMDLQVDRRPISLKTSHPHK